MSHFNRFLLCFLVVAKEHEMEIGHPKNVTHVAHVGWDNASVHAPSWVCFHSEKEKIFLIFIFFIFTIFFFVFLITDE